MPNIEFQIVKKIGLRVYVNSAFFVRFTDVHFSEHLVHFGEFWWILVHFLVFHFTLHCWFFFIKTDRWRNEKISTGPFSISHYDSLEKPALYLVKQQLHVVLLFYKGYLVLTALDLVPITLYNQAFTQIVLYKKLKQSYFSWRFKKLNQSREHMTFLNVNIHKGFLFYGLLSVVYPCIHAIIPLLVGISQAKPHN